MLELEHQDRHQQDLVSQAKRLGNEQLIARLKRLVAQDREVTARLLVHFGEVDARGLYRDQAYHSMFEYAVQALHMSESEAGLRIRVSRLGRQFPVALEMLARGELHLTALKLLAPVLTRDNLWLLEAARFKSKQQVLELLARQFPKQDAPSLIRRLPGPSLDSSAPAAIQPALLVEPGPVTVPTRPPSAAERAGESGPSALPGVPLSSEALAGDSCEARVAVLSTPHSSPAARTGESSDAHVAAPSRPPSTPAGETSWLNPPAPPMAASSAAPAAASCAVPSSASSFRLVAPSFASRETPLSSGRYKVQFTADQRLRDKLQQARELLRHQVPNGDIAVLFERALDLLIAQRKKQLFAQTDKPRTAPNNMPRKPDSRHVPNAVRREVLARDGEQCSFVSAEGRRCPARGKLEFHHRTPYARGGAATADNIQLLCQVHNALMAEHDYGRTFMRERIEQRRAAVTPDHAIDQRGPELADVALPPATVSRSHPARHRPTRSRD